MRCWKLLLFSDLAQWWSPDQWTYLQQRHKVAHELAENPILYQDHHQRDRQYERTLHQMADAQIHNKCMRPVPIEFMANDIINYVNVKHYSEERQQCILNDEQNINAG